MTDDVSTGLAVLVLRAVVVGGLYLFVLAVFRRLRAELTQASAVVDAGGSEDETPADWLELVHCEDAPDLAGTLYPLMPVSGIGRERGNTVSIPDPRISSRHARLEWRDGQWWVEDVGSANGTFVNGHAVAGTSPAGYDDTLRVGPAVLRLRRRARR